MSVLRGAMVVLLLVASSAAQRDSAAPAPRNADQAISAELQQKADQATGKECAKLSMRVARQALDEADRLWVSGRTQDAHAAVDVSVRYARRAVECTLEARKHQKNAEIELRALIRQMNDMARMLDSEERPQLTGAVAELEKERDRLLRSIFGSDTAGPRSQAR